MRWEMQVCRDSKPYLPIHHHHIHRQRPSRFGCTCFATGNLQARLPWTVQSRFKGQGLGLCLLLDAVWFLVEAFPKGSLERPSLCCCYFFFIIIFFFFQFDELRRKEITHIVCIREHRKANAGGPAFPDTFTFVCLHAWMMCCVCVCVCVLVRVL